MIKLKKKKKMGQEVNNQIPQMGSRFLGEQAREWAAKGDSFAKKGHQKKGGGKKDGSLGGFY